MERRPDPAPLEGDDVRVVAVGTVLWLLVGLALLPFHTRLDRHGDLWWIAAAFAGAGLGLVGLLVTTRRRRRLQLRGQDSRSSSSPASNPSSARARAT